MYQHDGCVEDTDNKRVWGIHRLKDFGFGGKCEFPQIQIRGFYLEVCKNLYPGCLLCGVGTGIPPPVVRMLFMGLSADWGVLIYRALTFLVISCPCALVISIPLSFFAGIGGASKEGVLVKGSNYLEILSQTRYVVLTKPER